jgi:hypothetical protein
MSEKITLRFPKMCALCGYYVKERRVCGRGNFEGKRLNPYLNSCGEFQLYLEVNDKRRRTRYIVMPEKLSFMSMKVKSHD